MGEQHTANMAFVDLFGPEILTKEGLKPTEEALAGKEHVMVYFSAHWCPPCRGYTPQLSEAYKNSTKTDKVAVVFVSSDRDEGEFDGTTARCPSLRCHTRIVMARRRSGRSMV